MQIRIVPLGQEHDRAAFSCGHASVDDYLKRTARQAGERNVAATFVAVTPNEPSRILAYYTLVLHSLFDERKLPEEVARKRKVRGLNQVPAILLAQLGVQHGLQGQGLGKMMLRHALYRCYEVAQSAGSIGVVTDPVDSRAATLYREKAEFVPVEEGKPRLILFMDTLAQAIEERLATDPQAKAVAENARLAAEAARTEYTR